MESPANNACMLAICADDFLQNVISLGGPDERFWILIMHVDVFLDGGDEFWNATKDTALESVC